jgi:signal transduction histidine kinase
MAFNVKARVLLELGAELISSDGIALYELIKNSVDAGSESVEIRIQVGLTPTGYKVLTTALLNLRSARKLTYEYCEQAASRYLDPSATASVRNEFMELLLGKTPTEAVALVRDFYQRTTFIEVEDWGDGMSYSDLRDKFLTIGTPNRVDDRRRLGPSAKLLGEKGIGRLSVMRLGLGLSVITGTDRDDSWSTLELDWSVLRDDPDLDIAEFKAKPDHGAAKDRADKGTLIRIYNLQSDWSAARLRTLARTEFSKLQDPFNESQELLDLQISFNGSDITAIEELDRHWLDKYHGYFEISFDYRRVNPDDEEDLRTEPVLSGLAKFKVPAPSGNDDETQLIDEKEIAASGDGLYSLLASVEYPVAGGAVMNDPARYAGIDTLGAFKAKGYWFNRQRAQIEFGKDDYEKFKPWLEQWAGGLLMYRDGYRVYPYASPDDDWLELDQRALRRRSFKLNRGQFVGCVQITSLDNAELRDQTNRQGLCDSPEKRALVQCLQHVIWKELGALVTKYEEKSAGRSLSTVREIEKQVAERARDAKGRLRELAKRAPQETAIIAELRGYVEELEAAWAAAKKAIKKQEGQAELYLHLAGVGMLLEFVIHELNRVTHATLVDLQSVSANSLPPGLKSLSRQLQTLDKRLRILDPVSTPGRQSKEETDICEILTVLLDAHEQQFERHNIKPTLVVRPDGAALESRVVVGQMYQIFENLIANSVYWLSHHRSLLRSKGDMEFFAEINILVDTGSRRIEFRDNGAGIEWVDREKIFEPFFSKKPAGRGIGLYIVKNLCKENGISVSLLSRNESGRVPGFEFSMP